MKSYRLGILLFLRLIEIKLYKKKKKEEMKLDNSKRILLLSYIYCTFFYF